MTLVEELQSMALSKAERTLPFGTAKPEDTLEGKAADEIERLRAALKLIHESVFANTIDLRLAAHNALKES